jgi:hypothetical protein
VIGSRVGGQITKQKVGDGGWYFKWFTNYGALAPYCSDLQGGISTGHSTVGSGGVRPNPRNCPRQGKPETDPANLAFVREAQNGSDGKAHYRMLDWDKGDRWTGEPWGFQGFYPPLGTTSKREVKTEQEEKAAAEA